MNLKQKLIAHRMNVLFILLLVLMASCIPFAYFNEIKLVIFPFAIASLMIFWLVYSSKEKMKLIKDDIIDQNHSDIFEDLDKIFKPKSKFKIFFAIHGLACGIFIIFLAVTVAVSIDTLLGDPFLVFMSLFVIYLLSYIIIKGKLQ